MHLTHSFFDLCILLPITFPRLHGKMKKCITNCIQSVDLILLFLFLFFFLSGALLENGSLAVPKSKFDDKIEIASAKMYFHYYGQLLHQQNMLQDYVRTGCVIYCDQLFLPELAITQFSDPASQPDSASYLIEFWETRQVRPVGI